MTREAVTTEGNSVSVHFRGGMGIVHTETFTPSEARAYAEEIRHAAALADEYVYPGRKGMTPLRMDRLRLIKRLLLEMGGGTGDAIQGALRRATGHQFGNDTVQKDLLQLEREGAVSISRGGFNHYSVTPTGRVEVHFNV